ncbi:MAG TPA: hypothetical protein VEO01_30340 [Pseudonocardiaceae bacterium]|nr:hypothetical protein [Pseudonocardiaceae bacterium]
MSRLSDGDGVLHDDDGRHLTKPPAGTGDQAAWREQLRRHLAQHRRKGQAPGPRGMPAATYRGAANQPGRAGLLIALVYR